jgi:hypothetical protein
MKKTVLLMGIMMSVIPVFAQDYWLVSASEAKDFWHAMGWVFTFNLFVGGALLLPFIGKKILHVTFVIFLPVALWMGYLMVYYYHLNMAQEIVLFLSCCVPWTVVYGYSAIFLIKKKSARAVKYQKQITDWTVMMRYFLTKKLPILAFPFVVVWTYVKTHTPRQLRKKHLRSLGWDVDSPEVFPNYLILHRRKNVILNRRKNTILTCTVSRDWKHIPMGHTGALGSLSLESQHEIQLLLDYLKIDITRLCEREKLFMDERIIVCGKRSYSPRYMLSKIERKTPLGMRFLHEYVKKIMEASASQRRIH